MQGEFRVYRSLEEAAGSFGPCALTIGNFDGVHQGHQQIMQRVAAIARERKLAAAAMTFDPHPTTVVAPARAPRLLSTPEQRCEWMREQGIRRLLLLRFDEAFSKLTAEEFVKQILVGALQARAVLVGENFRFGHRQAGDTKLLSELGDRHGFLTEVISGVTLRRRMVSSSEIRRLIEAGDVSAAGLLLGRCYALEGAVVAGSGVGSRQTVPTLNLDTLAEVLPAVGVYVTRTRDSESGREWPSVTNVGFRPTFGGDRLTIETFLLEGLGGPAPGRIRVEFRRRLREERKFSTPEALRSQILRDVSRAQAYFRRLARWAQAPVGAQSDRRA